MLNYCAVIQGAEKERYREIDSVSVGKAIRRNLSFNSSYHTHFEWGFEFVSTKEYFFVSFVFESL